MSDNTGAVVAALIIGAVLILGGYVVWLYWRQP